MTVPAAAPWAVHEHLVARGLLSPGEAMEAAPMDGGVSCDVIAVTTPTRSLVVKRGLAQLRVEDEWLAKPERVTTEGRALRLAATLTPAAVPAVIDLDEREAVLAMQRAPAGWTNWRDDLMAGRIDTAVGHRVGELLATWQAATAGRALAEFRDLDAFRQLRIDPFHRTVADRHPELAGAIAAVADRLLTADGCLVHGDLSPKNMLSGPSGELWVLDWEVAHVGDPLFDVAFLLTHLVLKALHRPCDADRYRAVAAAFLDAYGAVDRGSPELAVNVGCLLLARVDGKSPARYLDESARASARALGAALLGQPPADVLDIWSRAA